MLILLILTLKSYLSIYFHASLFINQATNH
jgi:hypothetical protein